MINNFVNYEAIAKLSAAVFDFVGKSKTVEYSKAVKELHDSEVTHKILETRINAIESDSQLSRNEKETLKNDVMKQYYIDDIKHVQTVADVVDRDARNRREIAYNLLNGLFVGLTAISVVYGATNGFQNYQGRLQIVPKPTR